MIKKLLLASLLLTSTSAFSAVACRITNDLFPTANAVHKSGKFRVFYSTNPGNADFIPDQTDVNNNNIPDYVENVAIQVNAADEAYRLLGFTNPLDSDRYRGSVDFIDIHITGTANGVAFESPAYAHPSVTLKEGKCGLVFFIRKDLEWFPGGWSVVAHELFHLYEYGYNQFKKPWYLEGMSNWAERVIRGGTNGAQGGNGLTPLPQKITGANAASDYDQLNLSVYSQGSAEPFWSRLVVLADTSNAQLNLPATLLNRTYVNGTTKVFTDEKLRGVAFMKRVMENLKIESDAMSAQYGRNPDNWSEADQTNGPVNFPVMTKAIQKTMHQFGMNKTAEEKSFLSFYQ